MNLKKKKIFRYLSIAFFGIMPLALASCTSTTSASELLNKSISIGDGNNLTSSISLKDYVKTALKSDAGMKAYVNDISMQLILDWFKRVADSNTQFDYKTMYDNQVKSVNETWDETVENYKSSNSSTWAIKAQQNDFDPNGGTEEAYKEKKMTEFTLSKFKEFLFNKDYLTFKDSNNKAVLNPTSMSIDNLYEALSKGSFLFANAAESNNTSEINIDTEYANFINYIWEKYVEIENPYVVNMSLWKYGTPSQGISDLYLGLSDSTTTEGDSTESKASTKEGESGSTEGESGSTEEGESTTTPTAGSYTHPFFGNDAATPTSGTLTKFSNFVSTAKNATAENSITIPFKSDFDTKNYGLLQIPNEFTDDSSTYILAKNGTIYTDLYPEFAAASSYLFWRNNQASTSNKASNSTKVVFSNKTQNSGITSIDASITKKLNTVGIENNANGLDPITSLFVSTESIYGSTGTSGGAGGAGKATDSNKYQLKLSKDYVSKLINPNGVLKSIANSDLYVADSFIGGDNNLTNFMFLRNQAGVHAISIDGAYYINATATTNGTARNITTTNANSTTNDASTKKKNAGQVVLFRSLLNNIATKPSNYEFSIDIKNELKTFFENNLSWLVLSYAFDNSTQKLFKIDSVFAENSAEKTLAKSINNFLHQTSLYNRVYNYNNTLVKQKSTYSTNFGVDAYKNGFAAPWTYKYFDTTATTTTATNGNYTADRYRLNPFTSFEVAATVDVVNNPYTATDAKSNDKNPDGTDFETLTELNEAINAVADTIKPLESTFEGFKYTQYIYSNSKNVNRALIGFFSEGDNLKNLTQISYLKEYVSDIFDSDKLEFKSSSKLVKNGDAQKLNDAMNNFFFNSTFDNSTYRWDRLNSSDNTEWNKLFTSSNNNPSSKTITKVKEILNKYKKQLWTMSTEVLSSGAISLYSNLYSTVASIKYMLNDDAKNFLTYLKTKNTIGADIYVAWQNSQNITLQKTTKSTAAELLSAETIINRNVNNGFLSDYIGAQNLITSNGAQTNNSPITVTNNTGAKSAYGDLTSSYWNVVGGMVGFKGIQTQASNSLASLISSRLFTETRVDNPNNVGALYGYESVDNLKTIIKNTSLMSSINSIATSLGSKLNASELTNIATNNELTLQDKKQQLLDAVSKLNSVSGTEEIFKQRKGIVGSGYNTATNKEGLISENGPVQYSAYAIQLNNKDLTSLETLKTALKNNAETTQPTPPASKPAQTPPTSPTPQPTPTQTTVGITEANVDEVVFNLIVQQSLQTDIQTKMLNNLLSNKKINVYDVRLYKALGPQWVMGWKETN